MISVLDLTIDIGNAELRVGEGDEGGSLDCAALVPLVGQTVKVELLNDTDVPLKATEVEVRGGDEGSDETGDGEAGAKVQAPVQNVEPKTDSLSLTHTVITVLGSLMIDVTNAELEGDDDESDGDGEPIDLTKVMVGAFVEVELDLTQPPPIPGVFVATELEVKNFDNHVEVEVVGPDGEEIDDRDEAGDPVNDVVIRVAETVKVHRAGRRHGRRVTRVLHFHTRSNGSAVLSGLPTGHGRVSVTRVVNGSTMTGQGRVVVGPNTTRHRRIVLHHAG
jgi:hypothetical protein